MEQYIVIFTYLGGNQDVVKADSLSEAKAVMQKAIETTSYLTLTNPQTDLQLSINMRNVASVYMEVAPEKALSNKPDAS